MPRRKKKTKREIRQFIEINVIEPLKRAVRVAENEIERLAGEVRDELVETIESQSLPLTPLSPAYLAWKQAKGLDTRILIRTGHYLRHIEKEKTVSGPMIAYFIGVNRKARAVDEEGRETDLPLWLLAQFLEYGTRYMPARPHWRPVKQRMQSRKRQYQQRIMRRIRMEIAKRGDDE